MAANAPYEIWVTDADGEREWILFQFTGILGLDDADAKTLAVARLQDIIDKINTPAPDSLVVKTDALITGPAYHLRFSRREDELGA